VKFLTTRIKRKKSVTTSIEGSFYGDEIRVRDIIENARFAKK
jgi:hypothetical protein